MRQSGSHGERDHRDALAVAQQLGRRSPWPVVASTTVIRSGTQARTTPSSNADEVLVLDLQPQQPAAVRRPCPRSATLPRAKPPVVRRSTSTTLPSISRAAPDGRRAPRPDRSGPAWRGRSRSPGVTVPSMTAPRACAAVITKSAITAEPAERDRDARAPAARPTRRVDGRKVTTLPRQSASTNSSGGTPGDVHGDHLHLGERAPHARRRRAAAARAAAAQATGSTPLEPPISTTSPRPPAAGAGPRCRRAARMRLVAASAASPRPTVGAPMPPSGSEQAVRVEVVERRRPRTGPKIAQRLEQHQRAGVGLAAATRAENRAAAASAGTSAISRRRSRSPGSSNACG